jgi:hypothetical protein
MNLRFATLGVCLLACVLAPPAAGEEAADYSIPADPRNLLPRWWKLDLELRGRLDGYQNAKAKEGTDQEQYLHRLRLTSSIRLRPWLRLVAQLQDSRVAGYPAPPAPRALSDHFDLRQAYLEMGHGMEGEWNLRIGRQPIVFGDMRLVSTSNWGNVGPNYDGVRMSWTRRRMHYDAFLTEVVVPCGGFNHPSTARKLHGFYATWNRDRALSDFYFFYKSNQSADHSGAMGMLRLATMGTRHVGQLRGGFDYTVEMALQSGAVREDAIASWAGHWEVGKKLKRVRAAAEYNYATGDRNPDDSERNSFDQLYPTNVYGTATDFGWRNIHEPVATVNWTVTPKLQVKTAYHAFWLASKSDALYLFNGVVFVNNPKATHSFVGNEIDTRLIWQMRRRFQLYTGYAFLQPGAYLKEAGRNRAVHYPYIMWTLML